MKIQFIYAASATVFVGEEYLGISRIYANIKSQNRDCILTKLLFDAYEEEEFNKIDLSCDVFAFSIYNDAANFIFRVIRRIRQRNKNAIIILGSQFASNCYELIFKDCKEVDFVVLGHGEHVIASFLEAMDMGESLESFCDNHPNIATPRCHKNKVLCNININHLMPPAREILDTERLLFAGMVSKHGCSNNCTFCSVKDKGSSLTPEDVFGEIISVYKNTGIRCFNFVDPSVDDFGEKGKNNIIRLCEMLIEYDERFSFRCYVRSNSFYDTEKDRKILFLMKEAGFNNIFVGVEAGNSHDLELYGKKVTVEDNLRIIRLFRNIGIEPKLGFIMINPFSNMDTLEANYLFLKTVKSSDISHYISCLDLYYNSEIYHTVMKCSLLGKNHSYIDNLSCYKIVNRKAYDIFKFIHKYFIPSDVFRSAAVFNNLTYTLSYLIPLMGDKLSDYTNKVDLISQKLSILHIDYFSLLYMDGNITNATKQYTSYINEVINLHNSCNDIVNGLLKKYLRSGIANFKVK